MAGRDELVRGEHVSFLGAQGQHPALFALEVRRELFELVLDAQLLASLDQRGCASHPALVAGHALRGCDISAVASVEPSSTTRTGP